MWTLSNPSIAKRAAFLSAALISSLSLAAPALAQRTSAAAKHPAKDATPAVAPATSSGPVSPDLMKARMRPPVKGTAYVEIIKGTSKKIGDEIVTVTKVRNTSEAPIVGLKVEEFWYDRRGEAGAGEGRVRFPLAPGEVVEVTTKSPYRPGLTSSNLRFSHQNGSVKPTSVKKFPDDTTTARKK